MPTVSATRLRRVAAAAGVAAVLVVAVLLLARFLGKDVVASPRAAGSTSASATADASTTPATTAPPPSAAATTPAPAPAPAPWSQGIAVQAPVAIGAKATYPTGVTAIVTADTRVDVTGNGPGETSGPAVALTITLHNGTAAAIDLDAVVVDLYADDGRPGEHYLYDSHADALTGTLPAGQDAVGAYVLGIPDATSGHINVTVSYDGARPAVAFQGTVPA